VDISGYSADELRLFQSVLDAAMTEAAERDIEVPIALMAKRLFHAAGNGVRDLETLKRAVLGLMPLPPPLPTAPQTIDHRATLRASL
jgi:hypothetical protein